MSGGRAAPWGLDVPLVVVTGDPGHVGDTDGFKGGVNCGVEVEGGGYKQDE